MRTRSSLLRTEESDQSGVHVHIVKCDASLPDLKLQGTFWSKSLNESPRVLKQTYLVPHQQAWLQLTTRARKLAYK